MEETIQKLKDLANSLELFARLKAEHGADAESVLAGAVLALEDELSRLTSLGEDAELAAREPNEIAGIRALRPDGPRRLDFNDSEYSNRLAGAFFGRSAGCILGAPVELWTIERMNEWAEEIGDSFPPEDFWSAVTEPARKRYRTIPRRSYARPHIDGIPVDDDLQYTILGLLILEDYGPDFTTEDVGRAWKTYLPFACTAEDVALTNLLRGVSAVESGDAGGRAPSDQACYMSEDRAAELHGPIANPYSEWIGADIRADPWGYVAPGNLELAANLAFRDAYVSHRRNGVYGAMYFSAAVAAAFCVDDPMAALKLALTEIPADCSLARALNWAFEAASDIRNYRDAHDALSERFPSLNRVHTINNACLTLFGIHLGGTDLSKVIGETVAMGYDNDCTAATAGSIVGAVIGRDSLESKWVEPFGDRMYSYLKGKPEFSINDLLSRFEAQFRRLSAT